MTEDSSSFPSAESLVKAMRLAFKPYETTREVQSRLRREEADAEHQRRKDIAILRAVLIAVGVVSVVCIAVVLIPGVPPENARWATTLLTSIVPTSLGYMTGRNSE